MEIRFEIASDTLSAGIARALAASQDFTPAMAEVVRVLETGVRERFETGRDPQGKPWTPSQRAIAQGGRTLDDTGALLSSMASASDSTSAVVGTNLVYAAIHQAGGTIRPKRGRALNTPFGPRGAVRMPARPFLGFGAYETEEIEEILGRHLRDALEGRP
jgi:phage virion morphogenesis protein